MQKRLMIPLVGLALAATLAAQETVNWRIVPQPGQGMGFQQAGTLIGPTNVVINPLPGKLVTGSPFSATQERHTVQTLGDGTVLENSETTVLYRDAEGRTRVEQTQGGRALVVITDPVGLVTLRLDPSTKTAWKSTMAGAGGAGPLRAGTPVATGNTISAGYNAAYEAGVLASLAAGRGALAAVNPRGNTEDLGMMHQNGVPAQGTRTTLTIPVGQIGNNREIKVVNERWYSQELQMVVKSVNSDPRFGTTTYELRNITRSNPDTGLFQVPADYTVTEAGGGRGGRGVVPVPDKK